MLGDRSLVCDRRSQAPLRLHRPQFPVPAARREHEASPSFGLL